MVVWRFPLSATGSNFLVIVCNFPGNGAGKEDCIYYKSCQNNHIYEPPEIHKKMKKIR